MSTTEQPYQIESADRWIASVEDRIPRTKYGLLDIETLSQDWYTDDKPQRASVLVNTVDSYVLLGPGGAGKTTLIEEFKRLEADSVHYRSPVGRPTGT